MTSEPAIESVPLPLWRAVAGLGALAALVGVLLLLAPSYVENYRLTGRLKTTVATATPSVSEDDLRTAVLGEANAMHVPVLPGDVKVEHPGGKLEVQVKYVIQKSLGPYQVDLHFHPSARAK